MKRYFLVFIYYLRKLIIMVTLPAYVFVLLLLRCLISFYNIYIRAVFTTYIVKRKDVYYKNIGLISLLFYALLYLGIFQYLFLAFDFGRYKVYINMINQAFTFIKLWSIKVIKYTIPFVLINEIFLNQKVKKTLIRTSPGELSKYFYRKKAMSKNMIFAGTERSVKAKPLFISDEQRSLQNMIIGSTGTGKSESAIFPWWFQDIKRGRGAIVVDAKGSMNFLQKLYTFHVRYNSNNQVFKFVNLGDPSFSYTYNPIYHGNAIEIKDRIMGAFEWSEQFYKTKSESALLTLLQAIESINKKVTFDDLYLLFTEQKAVDILIDMVKNDLIKRQLQNNFKNEFTSIKKDCAGLINNLYLMARGGISSIVNVYDPDINLSQVYLENQIIYFTLPTTLIGETARAFGKMLLMDLKSTAGYIEQKNYPRRFFPVFIDEFAEFASKEFIGWLNKARSSGFAVHIAFQSLGDLEQVDEAFVKQVIDNTNLKVVFRLNDSDTAESFSKQLGTESTVKETERIDKTLLVQQQGFQGSLREVEEFLVNPNEFKRNLPRGQALVFAKHPTFFNTIIHTDYLRDPSTYEKLEVKHNSSLQPNPSSFLNIASKLSSTVDLSCFNPSLKPNAVSENKSYSHSDNALEKDITDDNILNNDGFDIQF